MATKTRGRLWFEGLLRVLIIEVVVVVLCSLLALAIGWFHKNGMSLLLFGAGVLIMSIGPFSMMGGWGTTRSWNYQYLRTLENNTMTHRLEQDAGELRRSVALIMPSVVIGLLTILIALVIGIF